MKRFLALLLSLSGALLIVICILILYLQKANPSPIITKGLRLKGQNEDINEYISSQMNICYSSISHVDTCYQDVAALFMRQFSFTQILSVFQNNEQRPEIFARCHEVTHFLSRIEYDNKKDISTVYNECTSVCHGGCYHGVIEEYFKDKQIATSQSGEEIMKKFIPLVCGELESYKIPRVYSECLHGIGHAAMFVNNEDVPIALKTCDYLSTTENRETCYGGVFMENSSSSTTEITSYLTKYTKADDPLYPCDVLDKKYLPDCYFYQSSYFAFLARWNWQQVGQLCLKVPREYQNSCFRTIGTNQVGYTQDIPLMKRDCESLPTTVAIDECVKGVIDSFVGRFVNDTSRIITFCELVSSSQKQLCYREAGWGIASWSTKHEDAVNTCNQLPTAEDRNWCINPG